MGCGISGEVAESINPRKEVGSMDYNKLTADLILANNEACQAAELTDDGGTANLDSVFLRVPRAREAKVLEAIKKAGLYCRGKSRWSYMGNGYFLNPSVSGQGNRRTKAVEVMKAKLQESGWDVSVFYQMD